MYKTLFAFLCFVSVSLFGQETTLPQQETEINSPQTFPLQDEADRLTTHSVSDIQGDMITLDNGITLQATGNESQFYNIKKLEPGMLKAGDQVVVVWMPYVADLEKQITAETVNLFVKNGSGRTVNVKPMSMGNALKVTEVKRNENAAQDSWHGYHVTLSDGSGWDGWFIHPNEEQWAPGDSVIWAYGAYPFLTPGNVTLLNLSKKDPGDASRTSFFGAAKFVDTSNDEPQENIAPEGEK